MSYEMNELIRELIHDQRKLNGFPINADGIPNELINEMEEFVKNNNATYDMLADQYAQTLYDLIEQGY